MQGDIWDVGLFTSARRLLCSFGIYSLIKIKCQLYINDIAPNYMLLFFYFKGILKCIRDMETTNQTD